MKFNLCYRNIIVTIATILIVATGSASAQSNDATPATKAANDALLDYLPFDDTQSFDDAHKGFIAPLADAAVTGSAGNMIWNPKQYNFIAEGDEAPDTVNPSLWRQSQLINISG